MFDLGVPIFAYIRVSIKGFTYLYWGIPVHICLSEKYLFILGTSCNLWMGLTTFKGGY